MGCTNGFAGLSHAMGHIVTMGNTKIHQDNALIGFMNHDIFRFDIAVNNTFITRKIQRTRYVFNYT